MSLPFPTDADALLERHGSSFAESHARIEDTRCASQAWHLSMVVPRVYRRRADEPRPPAEDAPEQSLALLRSPDGDVELEVCGALLDRDIAAADWLRMRVARLREDVVAERTLPSAIQVAGDVLSVSGRGAERVVSRRFAFADGPRLFVVEGRARERAYAGAADAFLAAITTARPLVEWPTPLVESLHTQVMEGAVNVAISHPASWLLTRSPDATRGVHTAHLVYLERGVRGGLVTVATVPRDVADTPQAAADLFAAQAAEAGFDGRLPVVAAGPRGPFAETWGATDPAALRGNAEVSVAVGATTDAFVLAGAFGPSMRFADEPWAITRRAHALVVELMSVLPAAEEAR